MSERKLVKGSYFIPGVISIFIMIYFSLNPTESTKRKEVNIVKTIIDKKQLEKKIMYDNLRIKSKKILTNFLKTNKKENLKKENLYIKIYQMNYNFQLLTKLFSNLTPFNILKTEDKISYSCGMILTDELKVKGVLNIFKNHKPQRDYFITLNKKDLKTYKETKIIDFFKWIKIKKIPIFQQTIFVDIYDKEKIKEIIDLLTEIEKTKNDINRIIYDS